MPKRSAPEPAGSSPGRGTLRHERDQDHQGYARRADDLLPERPQQPDRLREGVDQRRRQTTDSTLHRSSVLGPQVEAQADRTNCLLFLEHDGHGDTRMLVNRSGTIVEQYNFDAYGDLLG